METSDELIVTSGKETIKQQDIHETMLKELSEARQARDLYYTQLMECHRKQLTDSLKFETIKGHLSKMLSGMEAYHEENGKFESWQQSYDYCEAAKAARQLGRKGDIEGVVSEQMKEL